jgi:hypothetical protein
MEGGTDQWDTSGAVWIGNDFDQQTPYIYDDVWHQTVGKYHSFNHSWAYNIEAVKNYNLRDYLNTTYGQQYFDDTGIWLGPLVRRHQGLLSTKQEIDLRLFKSANLTFWTWWDTESGTRYDKKLVQVSSDHGGFKTVFQISGANCPRKSWQEITINLSAYCGHRIKIGFRFDTTDTKYNNYEGWYVDDVKVEGELVDWIIFRYEAPYGPKEYVPLGEVRLEGPEGYRDGWIDNVTGNGACGASSSYGVKAEVGVGVIPPVCAQVSKNQTNFVTFSATLHKGQMHNTGGIQFLGESCYVGDAYVGSMAYMFEYNDSDGDGVYESMYTYSSWIYKYSLQRGTVDISNWNLDGAWLQVEMTVGNCYIAKAEVVAGAYVWGKWGYMVPGEAGIPDWHTWDAYGYTKVDDLTINYIDWAVPT